MKVIAEKRLDRRLKYIVSISLEGVGRGGALLFRLSQAELILITLIVSRDLLFVSRDFTVSRDCYARELYSVMCVSRVCYVSGSWALLCCLLFLTSRGTG